MSLLQEHQDLLLMEVVRNIGMALVQMLKGIDPKVKIIAASGLERDLGGSSRIAQLEAAGVKTFLSKPYTAEKLLIALNDVLEPKLEPASQECDSPAV